MGIYKRLPTSRKKKLPPFYRPIDRLVIGLWEKRERLLPFMLVGILLLAIYGGARLFVSRSESKAAALLQEGETEKTVAEYPRSRAAARARVILGEREVKAENYDKALEWYRPVADGRGMPAVMRIGALQNLALIHLKKGESDRAISILEQAERDPLNASADYTRLLLSHVYEAKGDPSRAKEILKSLSEGAGSREIQEEARERLTWLEK